MSLKERVSSTDVTTRLWFGGSVIILLCTIGIVLLLVDRTQKVYDAYVDTGLTARARLAVDQFDRLTESISGDLEILVQLLPVQQIATASGSSVSDFDVGRDQQFWIDQLRDLFFAFAGQRETYFRIRYVSPQGRELIRVDRQGNRIWLVPDQALQLAVNEDYTRLANELQPGDLWFTSIALIDSGAEPRLREKNLRAIAPVFARDQTLAGFVVIDVDVDLFLESMIQRGDQGVLTLLVDNQGEFILHPDQAKTFALDGAAPYGWSQEFPALLPGATSGVVLASASSWPTSPLRLVVKQLDLGTQKLHIAYALPEERIDVLVATIRDAVVIGAVSIAVLLIVLVGLGVRLSFRPIRQMSAIAKRIGNGEYDLEIPQTGSGEFQILSRTFANMLVSIRSREVDLIAAADVLEEARSRLKATVDNLSEGVVIADLSGQILDFNSSAMEMHGFDTPEEYRKLLSQYPETFELTKLDGEVIPLAAWPLARVLAGDVIHDMELLVRNIKTGIVQVFAYGGSLAFDDDGEPLLAVLTIRNVTERRRMEDRIRSQLEHLNLLDEITRAIAERQDLSSIFRVVIRRLEDSLPIDFGCVCLINPSGDSLQVVSVGVRTQALSQQLSLEANTSIEIDDNGLGRCVSGRLVYEPDIRSSEFQFPRRLAESGVTSMVLAPLRHESQVFGVLVAGRRERDAFTSTDCEFLRQVSEHVALASHQTEVYGALQTAYEDLRQSQQAIMQQERLKALGQMASGIAHDINNALSPVSLYTESMLETETGLSDNSRRYLETIALAVDDVAETVARMREFYRPMERELKLGSVNINKIVEQVVEYTRARWSDIPQEQGIDIEMHKELDTSLPRMQGVESEVREALTNLVFNAVDAMPDGGAITIRTELRSVTDGSVVVLEVIDAGVGMDEKTRKQCLEPFFSTKGERGTGLGLAMVYGIAQRHHADLEIDSESGQGTTIRIVFPSTIESDVAVPVLEPGERSRLRLLVIDDDPILLNSLQDILESDGHKVTAVNGGQAGIDAFAESLIGTDRFDAVITDLGMPYVDGRKVGAKVKELASETLVILLTGWGQRLVADNEVPPFIDEVLAKPAKLKELRTTLARVSKR